MSRIRILAAMVGLSVLAATATDLNAQSIGEGTFVTAKTNAPVYTNPPEGAFHRQGRVIDSVVTNERLRVRETKEIATLSARHLYLKVELPPSSVRDADPEKRIGWVYFGPIGGKVSNFQISEGQPLRSN